MTAYRVRSVLRIKRCIFYTRSSKPTAQGSTKGSRARLYGACPDRLAAQGKKLWKTFVDDNLERELSNA